MNNIIERKDSDVALSEEVCEKIVSLEKQAKEIKKQQDSMKAEILDAMQKYGVVKLDNEFLKIALVPEHDAEVSAIPHDLSGRPKAGSGETLAERENIPAAAQSGAGTRAAVHAVPQVIYIVATIKIN